MSGSLIRPSQLASTVFSPFLTASVAAGRPTPMRSLFAPMSADISLFRRPFKFPSFADMALAVSGKGGDGSLVSGIIHQSSRMLSQRYADGINHVHRYADGDLSYEEMAPEGFNNSPTEIEVSAVNKEGTCEYTARAGILTYGKDTKPTTLWSIKPRTPVTAAEHDAIMSDFEKIKSAWNTASQFGSDEQTKFDSLIKNGLSKEAGEMIDVKATSVFTADGPKFSDQGWGMCLTRTVKDPDGHESQATTELGRSRDRSASSSAGP